MCVTNCTNTLTCFSNNKYLNFPHLRPFIVFGNLETSFLWSLLGLWQPVNIGGLAVQCRE